MPNPSDEKQIRWSITPEKRHWVGDGFYVAGLLRPTPELLPYISPFILMDYAAPKEFTPSESKRGVGEHPHRGFETVTLAYQGEVSHRDSSGGGGTIFPGEVQWMTAGSGIVHDEFHSEAFSRKGGTFEMIQLWVNLPQKDKWSKPKYQALTLDKIPIQKIGTHSKIRVIAGDYEGTKGPASTFTPITIYDLSSVQAEKFELKLSHKTNTILLVLEGHISVKGTEYPKSTALVYERDGKILSFEASKDFKGVVLNGEPIDEPVVAHGPFVMNTRAEISQAIADYQNGLMGRLNS